VIEKHLSSPGATLRAQFEQGTVLLPGCYDAITAKVARKAGAKALYLSGAGVTNSVLAVPDIALVSLEEMVRQARNVVNASGLPVVADADTGFGDTLNVIRTVREYERAGLAGLHIEDQRSPKRCGHLDGKELISAGEMAAKIIAGQKAKSDSSFLIIARTDARGVSGLEDAIARARSYEKAGADAIFPEGLQSIEEFKVFREEVQCPLMANMTEFGKTPLISVKEFSGMGYEMVIFPMTAFRTMLKSVTEAYETLLKEGTQKNLLDKMKTRSELYEMIDYKEFEQLDRTIAEEAKRIEKEH
jgi:methylisocitrate lyase